MYLAGKLNLDDLVTREYRLDQINDGFRDMLEGNVFEASSATQMPTGSRPASA